MTPYLATPASTVGWQIYTDSAYHFKTVIPPGWRIGTALDPNSLSGGDCEYEVIYFPPGDTHSVEPHVTVGMHEFMQITVYLECPQEFNPAKDEYVSPRGSVTISGVATTLYGEDNNQDVDRFAVAEFGGHSYSFVLTGQSEQHTAITADVPLYLGVLSGFVYQGSK